MKTKREIIEYIRIELNKLLAETDSVKTQKVCQDLIQSIDHDLEEIDNEARNNVEDY